ncbi:MAG: hypothetical protein GY832_36295 [Chloroflexi bacterium]|nr:hypothetical protein [Chloroflexota bacterium]
MQYPIMEKGCDMNRDRLLSSWANHLANAARNGALTGKACNISKVETISGPRAGALEIFAGLESGRLLRALSKNDCANLRQFVPWQFAGDPQAFMSGRYVRVEAGWSSDLADSIIRLGDISNNPGGAGRWVAGVNECGQTIIPGLSDKTPHFLVSGATGSGKSVALQSAILQLSQDTDNQIVLVDGKQGESLKPLERLPNVLGPCAVEGPQVRGALGWAVGEMKRRYTDDYKEGRIILVVDEFQELVQDAVIVDLLRKLVAQGRAAQVHTLLATQHPTVSAFGDSSIRRNLIGKVALHVLDADASRVAVGGSSPRADYLLGAGDSYTIAPGNVHRVQLAYVNEQEITAAMQPGHDWQYSRWPDHEPENIGQDLPKSQFQFTGDELGVAIVSAAESEGRTRFTNRMADAGFGKPGYHRQKRLRELGKGAVNWMTDNGYAICKQSAVQDDYNEVLEIW